LTFDPKHPFQIERDRSRYRGQTEERIREQDHQLAAGNRHVASTTPHGNPTTAATA